MSATPSCRMRKRSVSPPPHLFARRCCTCLLKPRCLTLQSRRTHNGGARLFAPSRPCRRCVPLISNVRFHSTALSKECPAEVGRLSRSWYHAAQRLPFTHGGLMGKGRLEAF